MTIHEMIVKVDKLTNDVIDMLDVIDNITNLTAFKLESVDYALMQKKLQDMKHMINSISLNL